MRHILYLAATDSNCDSYGVKAYECASGVAGPNNPNPVGDIADMLSYTGLGVLLPIMFVLVIIIVSLAVFIKRMRQVKK